MSGADNSKIAMWALAGIAAIGATMAVGGSPSMAVMCGGAVTAVGLAVQSLTAPVSVKGVKDEVKEKKPKKVKGTGGKPLPQEEPKKQKAKKEAPAAAPAAADEDDDDEDDEAEKKGTLSKKQKQKAKKAADAAKAAAEVAAEAASEAGGKKGKKGKKGEEKPAAAAPPTPAKKGAAPAAAKAPEPEAEGKKKKKKKKEAVKVESSEDEEEEVEDGWEVQKTKASKTKAAPVVAAGETAAKAPPQHTQEVRIDSKFFGKIIGENGATRQALSDASGVDINIPKKGGMQNNIVLSGTKEACALCATAIIELTTKGYCSLLNKDTMDDGIEVPAKLHGIIIGPGGSNIKKIQAKTGVKVNMPDRESESNRITIVGDKEGVKMALIAIKELMATGFSTLTHENFIKDSIVVQASMIASLIGAGGQTIKDLQARTGAKVNIPDSAERAGSPIITIDIVGEPEGVQAARALIAQLMKPPKAVPVPEEWSQAATALMVGQW